MWRIFSRAERVVSWLGEGDKSSESALDLILGLGAVVEKEIELHTGINYPSLILPMGAPNAGKSSTIDWVALDCSRRLVTDRNYWPPAHSGVALNTQLDDIEILGHRSANASKISSEIVYTSSDQSTAWGTSIAPDSIAMTNTKLELDIQTDLLGALPNTMCFEAMKARGCLARYDWNSILTLLGRPYFGRAWVVQELFYAGNVFNPQADRCLLMCGHRTLSRPLLLMIWQILESMEVTTESYEQHGYAWMFGRSEGLEEPLKTLVSHGTLHGQPDTPEIFNVLRDAHSSGDGKLSRLITSTMSFKATDPRDKVYALLRMAGVSNEDFPVDYSQPANQVLQNITVYAVQQSGNLRVLEGNRHCTDAVTPSRIPDPAVLPVRSIEWTHHNRIASSKTLAKWEYNSATSSLELEGILVSKIKTRIGPFKFGRGFTDEDLAPLRKYYTALDTMHRETFWRTLVMDLDRTNALKRASNYPAPPEFGQMCDIFLGSSLPLNQDDARRTSLFLTNMYDSAQRRCFIELENGMMGLGPFDAIAGDSVVILFGGDVCFALREKEERYQLVGDCYVHGVMQGQLMVDSGDVSAAGRQMFTLC